MASPSAGMTKAEIKQRLAQMQKQYAQMQKKLEKSDKAVRVKRHVSKKIADYRRKQATGESPECTFSKAAELPKGNPESTGSPSLPTVNRGRLSSEPKVSTSREKSGKRRSVSFALSSQSTPTSSRHDLVQEVAVSRRQSRDTPTGVNEIPGTSVSPQQHVKKIDRVLKKSGEVPNKKLFRSAKSEKQEATMASSGVIVVDQSTDANASLRTSDHLSSGLGVSAGKDEETVKKSNFNVGERGKSISHLPDIRKNKVDSCQVHEILSSPDAKTPPEDTQFDLFADSDAQDESPQDIVAVSDSLDCHSTVSNGKMVPVDRSLQAVSPCGQHLKLPGQVDKDLTPDSFLKCELKGHKQELQESVVMLDETQGDIFHSQTPKKCTRDDASLSEISQVDSMPVVNVAPLSSTSNNYSETVKKSLSIMISKSDNRSGKSLHHVKMNKEDGVYTSRQDMIHSVSDEEGTEDPDVIPSSFPEDLEPVTKNKPSVFSQNLDSGHSDAIRSKFSQGRDPLPLAEKQNKDFHTEHRQITIHGTGGNDERESKICSQRTKAKQVHLAQTRNITSGSGESVDDKDTKCALGNSETLPNTDQSEDPHSADLDSQDVVMYSQENTSQKVPKSPEEKGKTGTQRRRRKNQRSIDNLSVDDISLKDFVVSQQNNQEGSHTWIDGLMYPAEYYVRKTRSMSKPSPNQYSAPLPGQKLSSRGSKGRKGPLSRSSHKAAMSEPLVHTKLMDEEQCQDEKDMSEGAASEKIDLGKDNTYVSVEKSQDSVGRRHNEISESVHKKPSPPRKMKVLRKPAAAKRRKGRNMSNRKLQSDSEQNVVETAENSQMLAQIGSYSELNEPETSSGISSGVIIDENERDQTEVQNIAGDSDRRTLLSNNGGYASLTRGEIRMTASPSSRLMTGLDPLRKPVVEDMVSNANGLVCEGTKHVSITQLTNNPLESQYTQTQVPSNFALPQVFGSPGHSTQCLVGLSPGSPTSAGIRALGSPPHKQTTSQHDGETNLVPSLEQRRYNVQNQECSEHQWMSEVYLADVVPELPVDVNSENQNLDNLQEADAGRVSVDENDMPLSHDRDTNCHLNILHASQCPDANAKASDVPVMRRTQLIENMVQDTSNIAGDQDLVPENFSYPLPKPCHEIKETKQHLSENTPTHKQFDHKEPILDHIPSSASAFPSSLCSNIAQGSPMDDAATGTPPEVAEMPQAQSQCTDSYRDEPEFGNSPGKEIAGGDLSVRECFKFRGCLEHKPECSSEVKCIISSRLVTEDVSEPLIAVVFPEEIIFWVLKTAEIDSEFHALCSWKLNEDHQKIILVELLPGLTDAVNALVAVGDEERSNSVRCIRWDCKKARWKDDTVLSSGDMPQTTYTSLCALQERKAAIAVHKMAVGSEVLVVGLGSNDSSFIEKQIFPVAPLPASKDRINSLTIVEGAIHMLLGLTDSEEVLLWHVPSQQLVQEFHMKDQRVNCCIQATAESGLLFMVACSKQGNLPKGHSEEPSCSLLVVNPLNGRSSQLLSYSAPCMQPGVQIHDVSLCNGKSLAACLTSGHVCLWDLYSSQLLVETCPEPEKGCTPLCLQDERTLLLGTDSCVNIYERNF